MTFFVQPEGWKEEMPKKTEPKWNWRYAIAPRPFSFEEEDREELAQIIGIDTIPELEETVGYTIAIEKRGWPRLKERKAALEKGEEGALELLRFIGKADDGSWMEGWHSCLTATA